MSWLCAWCPLAPESGPNDRRREPRHLPPLPRGRTSRRALGLRAHGRALPRVGRGRPRRRGLGRGARRAGLGTGDALAPRERARLRSEHAREPRGAAHPRGPRLSRIGGRPLADDSRAQAGGRPARRDAELDGAEAGGVGPCARRRGRALRTPARAGGALARLHRRRALGRGDAQARGGGAARRALRRRSARAPRARCATSPRCRARSSTSRASSRRRPTTPISRSSGRGISPTTGALA